MAYAPTGGIRLERPNGADQAIYIDTAQRRLRLIRNGRLIYDFPVAVGKPSTPTPVGRFSILQKTLNPGGAFGTRWMRFTERGHGIHGTNEPWLIGQAVSNGCVRMRNEDVERLYAEVSVGTPVVVTAGESQVSPGVPGQRIHVVRQGESLYTIARAYGVTVDSIIRANDMSSTLIYPGQRLVIPVVAGDEMGPRTHVVSAGESLYSIAMMYGVTVDSIMGANQLASALIYPGQLLLIP